MAAVMHAMQLFKEACAIASKGMAKVEAQERAVLAKHADTEDEESKKAAAAAIAEASAANEMLSRTVKAGQTKISAAVDVNDFSALEALEGDDKGAEEEEKSSASAAATATTGTTDVNVLFSEVEKAGAKAKGQNFVAKGERTVDDSVLGTAVEEADRLLGSGDKEGSGLLQGSSWGAHLVPTDGSSVEARSRVT